MSRRSALIILLLIVVIGVGLRSWQLTARSLWFDEAFSWRLVQFPVAEMIARDAADVHPPLYYLVLKAWATVFGTSLLALRAFSVALAGFTIAAGYLFVVEVLRVRGSPSALSQARWAGLVTAALLAVSGFQIQFAWEARMYTLGTVFAFLSSWLLLRAMRSQPQKLGPWVGYGVLLAAFAYVHYYAFFTIAGQVLFILGWLLFSTRFRVGEILNGRRFWYALVSGGVALLLYVPWIRVFLAQNAQVQDSFWIPEIGGWSIPDTFYRMYAPTSGIPQHVGVGWIALALVPIVLTGIVWLLVPMVRGSLKTTRDGHWLVVVLGVAPFIFSIILSFLGQSLYQDRFFVFAHLYIVVALALLIARVPWPKVRQTSALTLVVLSLFAFASYWAELDITNKPGAQAAAATVFRQRTEGQPVIVSSPFVYFAIWHYAQETYSIANTMKPQLYSEGGELVHFAGGPIQTPDDIIGPEVFETNSDTLWVVDTTGFGSGPLAVPEPWHAVSTETFQEVFGHQGDVTATRYQRR